MFFVDRDEGLNSGLDEMKNLYDSDPNFSKIWRECKAPSLT